MAAAGEVDWIGITFNTDNKNIFRNSFHAIRKFLVYFKNKVTHFRR